jgi:DNA topoisomerase-3
VYLFDTLSITAGKDAGDHPPITPTCMGTERQLGGQTFRVYEYVTRHFLATVSPDCAFTKVKTNWTIGAESFTSSTIDVTQPGFTLVLPNERIHSSASVNEVPPVGKAYKQKCSMTEGDTQPPPHLSESELITLMEKHGNSFVIEYL